MTDQLTLSTFKIYSTLSADAKFLKRMPSYTIQMTR